MRFPPPDIEELATAADMSSQLAGTGQRGRGRLQRRGEHGVAWRLPALVPDAAGRPAENALPGEATAPEASIPPERR